MWDFFCNFAADLCFTLKNDNMLEIIRYTIPALVVLLCTWLVMYKFYKNENDKRNFELKRASQKEISPIRLRAYERLTLVLERTQPEHLLLNEDISGMTIMQIQQLLLRTIRLEFDHNLSQQIYVSPELWDKIIHARDEMAAFVNEMAIKMPQDSTSMDYAQVLLTAYRNNGVTPHQEALEALQEEVGRLP